MVPGLQGPAKNRASKWDDKDLHERDHPHGTHMIMEDNGDVQTGLPEIKGTR